MNIQEHMTLEMHNVLSFRGKMTQQELAAKSQEIDQLIKTNGASKSAPTATTTFSVEPGGIMDIEILIPLDKTFDVPSGFAIKPKILITNALMIKHSGHPSGLENTINELNNYIMSNHLVPITTGYNVTVKDAKTPLELDNMEVEIYVGISPNIL